MLWPRPHTVRVLGCTVAPTLWWGFSVGFTQQSSAHHTWATHTSGGALVTLARLCHLMPRLGKREAMASCTDFSLSRPGSHVPYICSLLWLRASHRAPSKGRGLGSTVRCVLGSTVHCVLGRGGNRDWRVMVMAIVGPLCSYHQFTDYKLRPRVDRSLVQSYTAGMCMAEEGLEFRFVCF